MIDNMLLAVSIVLAAIIWCSTAFLAIAYWVLVAIVPLIAIGIYQFFKKAVVCFFENICICDDGKVKM